MKNILRRFFFAMSIVLFAVCGGAVLLMNRPVLGWQAFTVPTGSMRPGITPGSVVLVHQVATRSLHVGDVVTYTNPLTMRTTLTHRIIKIYTLQGKTPAIITQGDANASADPPAVMGLIKGKEVGHVPYVGTLFMWAKTWPGLIALIYLPSLIIIGRETARLAQYWRRMKPYHLPGFPLRRRERDIEPHLKPKFAAASAAAALLVVAGGVVGWQSAGALSPLQANIVALTPNVLTLSTPVTPPPSSGGGGSSTTTTNTACTNTTNVNVTNSATQSATSGSVNATGNTGGSTATSGSATNTNTSSTSIAVQNGC